MATIKIKRSNDYMMREFRLFIDGKKVGTIGNAQTKEFDIAAGQHSIIARIDWCRSPELTFETNDKDSKIFLRLAMQAGSFAKIVHWTIFIRSVLVGSASKTNYYCRAIIRLISLNISSI
jgi:hypothetical protein